MKKIFVLLLLLPIFCAAQFIRVDKTVRPSTVPTIFVNPLFLQQFSNVTGTASSAQTMSLNSQLLSASVTVTCPSGLEISKDGSTWVTTTLTYTQSGGVATGTVYARVKSTTAAGSYSGNIQFTSSPATPVNVSWTAVVSSSGSATITANPTSLPTFNATQGTASASQSSNINGSNLSNNIVATAPASFLVSLDNLNFFSAVTLNQSGGSVINTPLFIATDPAAAAGTPSGNVALTSSPATTVNIAVNANISSSGVADTVVFFGNMDSTAQNLLGSDAVHTPIDCNGQVGNGNSLTFIDTRNWRNIFIQTHGFVGIGSGARAESNTQGVNFSFSDGSPNAMGLSYWYNFINAWPGYSSAADTATGSIMVGNLDPNALYSIEWLGTSKNGVACPSGKVMTGYSLDSTNFRVDSSNATFNVVNVTGNPIIWNNKVPDAAGKIRILIKPRAGGSAANCSQFGYICYLRITKQAARK